MLVDGFDVFVNHAVILDQLFQDTCDDVGKRLQRLFFVVAINVQGCNVLTLEARLQVVNNDRTGM